MKDGPWVRFFPSDWLAGTRGLSAAETGIYITLIAMMYERGSPIPSEPIRLARLCGSTAATLKTVVASLVSSGKLELVDGGLWNRRVGIEVKRRHEKSTQAADSAATRWQKDKENQAEPDADAMRSQSDGNANQSQISDSPSLRSGERTRRANPIVVLQGVLDPMTAQTYANHLGRRLTPEMAELVVGTLREIQSMGGNPVDAVKLAIRKGWVSLEIEYLTNAGFKFSKPQAPTVDWQGRLAAFSADGTWIHAWGPKPGERGCNAPAELIQSIAA